MNAAARTWARRFTMPVFVATVLSIPVVALEARHDSGPAQGLSDVLAAGIWLIFLAELSTMLTIVDDRRAWLREHKLEVVLVIVCVPVVPPGLGVLRLLRILRLGRLAKISREMFTLRGLPWAILLTGLLVIAAGAEFSEIESSPSVSFWDGVWWATTTLTTVGYGDVSPHTDAGRVLAIAVMVLGIGFVAMLTAAVAQFFIRSELDHHEREDFDLEGSLKEVQARLERLEHEMIMRRSAELEAELTP